MDPTTHWSMITSQPINILLSFQAPLSILFSRTVCFMDDLWLYLYPIWLMDSVPWWVWSECGDKQRHLAAETYLCIFHMSFISLVTNNWRWDQNSSTAFVENEGICQLWNAITRAKPSAIYSALSFMLVSSGPFIFHFILIFESMIFFLLVHIFILLPFWFVSPCQGPQIMLGECISN